MRILSLTCLFLTVFGTIQAQEDSVFREDTVFVSVETLPVPKDGWSEFHKFVSNEIQYPEGEFENGEESKVIVQFIVERDGRLSDIKVYPGTEENTPLAIQREAVRVVSMSPKWTPGMSKNEPVLVRYQAVIKFSHDDKKSKKRGKK